MAVESFVAGRHCIGTDSISGFCRSTIIGSLSDDEKEQAQKLGLEISGMELQQMFISLTEEDTQK
jgi:hypothetical protein